VPYRREFLLCCPPVDHHLNHLTDRVLSRLPLRPLTRPPIHHANRSVIPQLGQVVNQQGYPQLNLVNDLQCSRQPSQQVSRRIARPCLHGAGHHHSRPVNLQRNPPPNQRYFALNCPASLVTPTQAIRTLPLYPSSMSMRQTLQ
jgi:hypothetical protein